MKPFYFRTSDKPLFGVYHAPARGSTRDCGVVLCYPIGHEYVQAHRAFRQLAVYLSKQGFPVIRFDYYGCGDSTGESVQGTIQQWCEDISSAIEEVRDRTRSRKVCLIGFRFGGTLAALAGAIQEHVEARGAVPVKTGADVPGLAQAALWGKTRVGEQLGAVLRSRGDVCTLVFPGKAYEPLAKNEYIVDPSSKTDFQWLLEAVKATPHALRGVVNLWSLDSVGAEALEVADLEATFRNVCGSTLHLVQALAKNRFSEPPSLWLVTRGAVPVKTGADVPGLAQAALWGLGKTLALEHPEVWGGMIDLSPEPTNDEVAALQAEIWDSDLEDHIAFRDGQRYVARLVRGGQPAPQGVQFQSDATYLITGGLGFLGLRHRGSGWQRHNVRTL